MSDNINKLAFLSKYGTDKHKVSVDHKITKLIHNMPEYDEDDDDPDSDNPRESIPSSSAVRGDNLTHFVHHSDYDLRFHAAKNPNLEQHHIDHIVKSGDHRRMFALATNQHANLSSDHIHKILDHPNRYQHPASVIGYYQHHRLDDSHWDKIARHRDTLVPINAINSGNMPRKHVLTALDHHDPEVNEHARQHLKTTDNESK